VVSGKDASREELVGMEAVAQPCVGAFFGCRRLGRRTVMSSGG
jgi:hypothetical protein